MDTPLEPYKLLARVGERVVGHFLIQSPGAFVLGRSDSCDFSLNGDGVSRQHARLVVQEDGSLLVEDLGSANGTFLDDLQVHSEPCRVLPKQTLRLGSVHVLIETIVRPELGERNERPPSGVGSSVSIASDDISSEFGSLPAELVAASRYSVGDELAKGGMGAVLRAREGATRRTVAMKVMLGNTQASPRHKLRFVEEAQITAQLEHPNIVPVHDLGVDAEGRVFYTMKLVQGITLKKIIELLREGTEGTAEKYRLPALLTILQKVCDAVAFAHAKGVIHRDLKPANIMVGSFGEVLVMDWGLAKVIGKELGPGGILRDSAAVRSSGSRSMPIAPPILRPTTAGAAQTVTSARQDEGDLYATLAGQVMGTPHYMAPEQARGETDLLDGRSDIFALGAILYEILTLQRPFPGKTAQQVIEKILSGEPPLLPAMLNREKDRQKRRLHLQDGEIPESLSAVAMKALAFRSGDRYPDVRALQADLTAYQDGFATSAENAGSWKQAMLFIRRNKAASIGVAAVVLVGSLFGTKAIIEGRRAERALVDLKETAPTFVAHARALIEQHRFDEALQNLFAARKLDPSSAEPHLFEGHIYQALQRFPEAESAYHKALNLKPSLAEARRNLELTESVAREAAGGPAQAKRAQARLQSEFLAQGRTGESTWLIKDLAADGRRNFETWLPILKSLGIQCDPARFHALPDGTLFLHIVNYAFSDLRPLSGMPLGELNIENTSVSDLTPLRGMPLRRLNARKNTNLTTIAALEGLPLTTLLLGDTGVRDISPVKGMKLTEFQHGTLKAGDNINDYSQLEGMPIEKLEIRPQKRIDYSQFHGMPLKQFVVYGETPSDLTFLRDTPIEQLHIYPRTATLTDISPLQGKRLIRLSLGNNSVSDLSPLKGMPLKRLYLYGSKITDLSPLVGCPLELVALHNCRSVSDLRPLAKIETLEQLVVPDLNCDLSSLRKLPHLQRVSTRWDENSSSPRQGAEEFWKEYDAVHRK